MRMIRELMAPTALAVAMLAPSAPGIVLAQDQLLPPIQRSDKTIALAPVADGLTAPNWGATAPGDSNRLFVTDQVGILWSIDLASGNKGVSSSNRFA